MLPVEEDITGLDVAVYDSVAVRVSQGVSHVAEYLHCLADRELALALETRPERLALDKGHGVVKHTARLPRREQGHNVRMLK